MAEDRKKKAHSENLSVLLYIAHLLPLAWMSEDILYFIFSPECTEDWRPPRNFHAEYTLNGWNDHIIQPARDAVLDYYKVHTRPISLHTVLALKLIQPNFICFSALRKPIQRQKVLARQHSILVSTCVWLYPFDRSSIVGHPYHIDIIIS